MRALDKLIVGLVIGCFIYIVWAAIIQTPAFGHYKPGQHNAIHAIQKNWCGKANTKCWRGDQAIAVARCESGHYWYTRPQWASNGQYQGMFQMGSWERSRFGHGNNVWAQAKAAHRYYRLSGWRPWECASILGIR